MHLPNWNSTAGLLAAARNTLATRQTDRAIARYAGLLAPSAASNLQFEREMEHAGAETLPATAPGLPAAFFEAFLGPQLHTGAGHFAQGEDGLMAAEHNALVRLCAAADVANGQNILDLSCGWGALALFVAEHYPAAHVTALTACPLQHDYVQAQKLARGLRNVTVQLAAFDSFAPAFPAHRIVTTELFARVPAWRPLLARLTHWLTPDGRLCFQVPTHVTTSSRPPAACAAASAALYGANIVPHQGLVREFDDMFTIEREQHWAGTHYARTAKLWLTNFNRNANRIHQVLQRAHGAKAASEAAKWRRSLMTMERLYAHGFGNIWGTASFTLKPRRVPAPTASLAARRKAALLQ